MEGLTYHRSNARYAKGMQALTAPAPDGFKTTAAVILSQMNARWSNRERAYIVSPSTADTFEAAVLFLIDLRDTERADIGQFNPAEKRALKLLTRLGWIVKGIGGPYPMPKTVYALPGFDFAQTRRAWIEIVMAA